jgi:hypothetical protein
MHRNGIVMFCGLWLMLCPLVYDDTHALLERLVVLRESVSSFHYN